VFLADQDLTPNRIETARRRAAAAGGLVDLTSSNPTQQGLLFPAEILRDAAAPYWDARRYEPDPRGLPAARDAIARYYAGRTPALPLSADDVFITASTSEAYGELFALLTRPGDNVLAPDVTYPLFDHLAQIHEVELRPYALDESAGWQPDPATLLRAADARTRAVLLVSPHNPTGAVVGARSEALSRLGLPLICDEVFAEFPFRVEHVPPLGALHPELTVFHLNGISKMFALPDLKLGWIALTGPGRAAILPRLEILNDTLLGANSLVQSMLPALFERGRPFLEHMRDRVRHSIDSALRQLGADGRVSAVAPDGGYYLFPAVAGWDDDEQLVLHLLQHGVFVHPGYFYGCEHGTRIMLSCLTPPETLSAGLSRLLAAL